MAALEALILVFIIIYFVLGLLISINDDMPRHSIITWGILLYIWGIEGKRKRNVRDYLNERYEI